jgi:2-methylcitrate dehydratase PrpD
MVEKSELGGTSLAQRIASFGAGLMLDSVPGEVHYVAKRCIIDLVGVAIAATSHPLTGRMLDHATGTYAPGAATVLGSPVRLSPVGAALVNGASAHVLDFDDTSYTGIMHGSAVAFPAALAATEASAGDGRRLLEAFIVGSEVTYAVALMCTTEHYFKGWWSTATFGAFGAAAAAAKALGLSVEQTTSALALAGAQACGPKAAFGTDAKPFLAGRAAAIGVEAALLAAKGLVGPEAIFEDSRGFLQLLNDGRAETGAIDDLGHVWRLVEPGIFFKQFPVCSAAHAAAELTKKLLNDNQLRGDSVRKAICEVPPTVAISLMHDRPRTPQEAQFSLPFAVGAMLARGKLDIDCLTGETLSDPSMKDAMAKVEMRRVDALHRDEAPEGARVTLQTIDGDDVTGYLGEPMGMPGNPMSDETLHEKFLRCVATGGLDQPQATALLRHLDGIESAKTAL